MFIIFDWDGTLSDSADRIIDAMQNAALTAEYPVCSREAIRNIIGLGLPEAIKTLYPSLSTESRQSIKGFYIDHFMSADQQPSDLFDGVIEGLHRLRDKNFLLGIATGKSRRGLDRVLSEIKLDNFFHGTRCADETASKPDPQMLLELLDEFDTPANSAVMVGDTEYDMSMAKQISMPRVAVSYGAHHVDRLKQYDPVQCVDEFSDFVAWVLSNKY